MELRNRLFDEEELFTYLDFLSTGNGMTETNKALYYMRDKHSGQYRKTGKHSSEQVPYINHPLIMAYHAYSLGIEDDIILAAILLHDVVEDTDVTLEELPFSPDVRALVGLVTFAVIPGKTKEESKDEYYKAIRCNGKACLIKLIDRCNNVSTMSAGFDRDKLIEYIDETEQYVLPLAEALKNDHPEYSDIAFVVKYQIIAVIETIKNLITD